MSAPTVGQRITWRHWTPGDPRGTKRNGTMLTPALWSGTWWVHVDGPLEGAEDIYDCALVRWDGVTLDWTADPDTYEYEQARALMALRAAGMAP